MFAVDVENLRNVNSDVFSMLVRCSNALSGSWAQL